jgi:hypothetical protein
MRIRPILSISGLFLFGICFSGIFLRYGISGPTEKRLGDILKPNDNPEEQNWGTRLTPVKVDPAITAPKANGIEIHVRDSSGHDHWLIIPNTISNIEILQSQSSETPQDYFFKVIEPGFEFSRRFNTKVSDNYRYTIELMTSDQYNGRKRILDAIRKANSTIDAKGLVDKVIQRLSQLNDEALFLRSIQVCRQDLETTADIESAAEIGILLIMRNELIFPCGVYVSNVQNHKIYLLPALENSSKRGYRVLCYDKEGKLSWVGGFDIKGENVARGIDECISLLRTILDIQNIKDKEDQDRKQEQQTNQDKANQWISKADDIRCFKSREILPDDREPQFSDSMSTPMDNEMKLGNPRWNGGVFPWWKVYYSSGKPRVVDLYLGPELTEQYLYEYSSDGKYEKLIQIR